MRRAHLLIASSVLWLATGCHKVTSPAQNGGLSTLPYGPLNYEVSLDFVNAIATGNSSSSPLTLSGVQFSSALNQSIYNYPGNPFAEMPSIGDWLGLMTDGQGAVITFPVAVSNITFEAGDLNSGESSRQFDVVVSQSVVQTFSVENSSITDVTLSLPDPSAVIVIQLKTGTASLLGIANLYASGHIGLTN